MLNEEPKRLPWTQYGVSGTQYGLRVTKYGILRIKYRPKESQNMNSAVLSMVLLNGLPQYLCNLLKKNPHIKSTLSRYRYSAFLKSLYHDEKKEKISKKKCISNHKSYPKNTQSNNNFLKQKKKVKKKNKSSIFFR